jgi:hypothetical protein
VKVDNLTDAQIEQLIKRAETSGMSEQQLEAMARERGMPATEVAKLRIRINQIRNKGGIQSDSPNPKYLKVDSGFRKTDFRDEEIKEEKPLSEEEKKIFGYSIV